MYLQICCSVRLRGQHFQPIFVFRTQNSYVRILHDLGLIAQAHSFLLSFIYESEGAKIKIKRLNLILTNEQSNIANYYYQRKVHLL
jgi:hypothetical protein